MLIQVTFYYIYSDTIIKCDFTANVILLGDSGVGKTALMMKFIDPTFQYTHSSTIGIDYVRFMHYL